MRAGIGKDSKNGSLRRVLRAPVISAACVIASALVAPTMVRAFVGTSESLPVSLAARYGLGSFTPASVDPWLLSQASIRALTHGKLFRFTPAGMESRRDRAVTVAVRVTNLHDHLIAPRASQADAGAGFAAVRIAPIAYNLGRARGYQSFALPNTAAAPELVHDNSDLRTFSLPGAGHPAATPARSPRLEANVALDERAAPGRSPRTLGTQGDYQVDMGGSYRVVGNLNVTAGLRYSSDRERLRALTNNRQDSQAIYVGTQFRF